MQNVNQRTEEQKMELQEKRREALKQYVGCALIFTFCVQMGIHATWEWSQSCQAWRLPLIQNLVERFQPYFAVIRGCPVGFNTPEGFPISNGWKIMTTHALLARRMELLRQCSPGTQHVKCEGSITSKTAYNTEGFAKRGSVMPSSRVVKNLMWLIFLRGNNFFRICSVLVCHVNVTPGVNMMFNFPVAVLFMRVNLNLSSPQTTIKEIPNGKASGVTGRKTPWFMNQPSATSMG
jgi:hypothetical protein